MGDLVRLVRKENSLKRVVLVTYILQALSFFLGITIIVALIIDYVKKEDAKGTWLESHFNWQIKTFWWGLFGTLIGIVLIYVGIGIIILFAVSIWMIYRIVKGWLKLNDNKEVK